MVSLRISLTFWRYEVRTLRASIEGFFGNKRYGVPGYASDGGYAVILVTVLMSRLRWHTCRNSCRVTVVKQNHFESGWRSTVDTPGS